MTISSRCTPPIESRDQAMNSETGEHILISHIKGLSYLCRGLHESMISGGCQFGKYFIKKSKVTIDPNITLDTNFSFDNEKMLSTKVHLLNMFPNISYHKIKRDEFHKIRERSILAYLP